MLVRIGITALVYTTVILSTTKIIRTSYSHLNLGLSEEKISSIERQTRQFNRNY